MTSLTKQGKIDRSDPIQKLIFGKLKSPPKKEMKGAF
jgi:hypothetical protein